MFLFHWVCVCLIDPFLMPQLLILEMVYRPCSISSSFATLVCLLCWLECKSADFIDLVTVVQLSLSVWDEIHRTRTSVYLSEWLILLLL